MPIPIHREPDDELTQNTGQEKCCFCRTPSPWWTSLPDRKPGEQVACCTLCAARGNPPDVPTKSTWCRREKIAHRPTYGEIARGNDRDYPPAPIVPIKEEPDDNVQQSRTRSPSPKHYVPTSSKARRIRDQF